MGNPVVIGDTLFIGDTGGSLYALSTETGQVRWSYAAESEIVASPAYLGFQTLSARGTTPLPGFLAAQALLPVPPNTPGVGGLVFGTVSGRVICLDAFDGQTRWQYGAGSPVTGAMQGKNGIVVFGTANGLLHALDAYTGKLRWVFQAGGLIKSRPAIGEGMVFATAWDKKVYAVDLATGQLRWTVELARSESVDFLLAVGGGSVLDATKFIAIAVSYKKGDPWDVVTRGADPDGALPIGCVLTLPATGSEMNCYSVITREGTKEKLPFSSPLLYPRFSVLDP
ncbi:MAG: iron-containing alcohol dehydrogenase [Acidobacteria bacterium]|nr:iron-containing alcohol dehydrogenase [Acidobacteriota bacterium]